MKIFRFGLLFAFVAVLGSMVVCRPEWLAENRFLDEFVSSEIVAVLIVILTITFASVANIHLSLNRIAQHAGSKFVDRVERIRGKVNADAWLIFWAFIICLGALVLKGAANADDYLKATAHAIAIIVMLVNVLVLHTIYRAIFALVATERLQDRGNGEKEGKGQDFSSESPPTE